MTLVQDTLAMARESGTTADLAETDDPAVRFARQALDIDKRRSLTLAVRARWAALAAIGVMLPFLNPNWDVLYYEALLLVFALTGWGQARIGRVGRNRRELLLIFCDLALLTVICVAPNPFSDHDAPAAMQYRFENFMYFYVLLAGAMLCYSWRTIIAFGWWTVALWALAAFLVWLNSGGYPELTEASHAAFGHLGEFAVILDPNAINFDLRVQEAVVFMIVAVILGLAARRSDRLLIGHAALERERANLARYFSPNVVEELSHNDEPLKQVRTQNIGVLFVDIVGFTAFAAERDPEDVIATLRTFHRQMEEEVFRHNGTLDKYLGDGLMATFGTPVAGESDAANALRCALHMASALKSWNLERAAAGEPVIHAGFGVHYGPVVLGDVGDNRLEFAVIGSTVNIASRLERLTRDLDVEVVTSQALLDKALVEPGVRADEFAALQRQDNQAVRGINGPMTIWTLCSD